MKNRKAPVPQPPAKKKLTKKPAWNEDITDMKRYQLSKVELLQRKVSCSSKNRLRAKEEITEAQTLLQGGKLPSGYRDAISHKLKKSNVKEEYRQKAKAIVYPMAQGRNVVSASYPLRPKTTVESHTKAEEPVVEAPVLLSSKVARVVFTSAKDEKVEPANLASHPGVEAAAAEPEEDDYLDCKANVHNLEKLQQELAHQPSEIEDCLSVLTACRSRKEYLAPIALPPPRKPEVDVVVDALGLQEAPEASAVPDFPEVPARVCPVVPHAKPDLLEPSVEANICGMDEGELDRISKMIAETQKDLNGLNANWQSAPEVTQSIPIPIPTPNLNPTPGLTSGSKMQTRTDQGRDNYKPENYETSYFHSSKKKTNDRTVPMANPNKENVGDPFNAGGIISRKVCNKTEISLSSAMAPRTLVIASQYTSANI